MTVPGTESGQARSGEGRLLALDRYRLLQASLLSLRAGPALILLLLIIAVSLTTPIFFTSRTLGSAPAPTRVGISTHR